MKTLCTCFLLCTILSGCLPGFNFGNDATLKGSWRISDVGLLNDTEKNGDKLSKLARLKNIVKEGDIISFFENGEYTELMGNGDYILGTYKLSADNRTLIFADSLHNSNPVKIKLEKAQGGKHLLILSVESKNLEMTFVKDAEPLKDFKDDPFYSTNNQWRIRPKQPENPGQLTRRLANYIGHLAFILKAAKERKQDIVSFEFSQGPVQIYNGGIGARPYKIVPDYWKKYFFNENDASSAYMIFDEYLRTSTYKGAGTGDWIQDDYNILLSIYAGLNQSTSTGKTSI